MAYLEFIADEAVNVAETVVRRMMLDKLKSSLTLLSEEERTLIQQHFYVFFDIDLSWCIFHRKYLQSEF